MRVALVGGAVRDLLLHRIHRDPWRGLQDLDLVVERRSADPDDSEPAAFRVAQALVASDPTSVKLSCFHGAYGTVELQLGDLLLDLATARAESYPNPGQNPVVRPGSLESDMARRDFSINAMALLLEPDGRSTLLDPHGGQVDLAARRLRLLHPDSLRDDPSRLLRGARYAARLGLVLDPASLEQARSTLAAWPWGWSHGDPPDQAPPALGTRLRMELELLLERENWRQGLLLLQSWGGLSLLDGALQSDRQWLLRLARAERFGVPRLAAFLAAASNPLALAERLQVPHRQQRLLSQHLELRRRLSAAGCDEFDGAPQAASAWPPSAWCALLEGPGLSPEAVALGLACGAGPRRPLLRWWLRWRHVPSPLSAEALMAQGVPRGPQLGQRLAQLRAERLDQER